MRLSSLRTSVRTTNEVRGTKKRRDQSITGALCIIISEVPIREGRLPYRRQGKTLQDWLCTDCNFVDE